VTRGTRRPRSKGGDAIARAGVEVLRRELHEIKKRCARIEQDERRRG
jgi:hypothetical protein